MSYKDVVANKALAHLANYNSLDLHHWWEANAHFEGSASNKSTCLYHFNLKSTSDNRCVASSMILAGVDASDVRCLKDINYFDKGEYETS
ncbi:hypothetical protein ElyMa_003387900 [Elysia marginata]|uniref:Uncharacterized protein n=1 Tax=Elysia marginata TaxID=1093978 RepID=A0AAV4JKV9_9GAST|nr:hypothetical protein ElyMa_003387900 [Elysia marginata]